MISEEMKVRKKVYAYLGGSFVVCEIVIESVGESIGERHTKADRQRAEEEIGGTWKSWSQEKDIRKKEKKMEASTVKLIKKNTNTLAVNEIIATVVKQRHLQQRQDKCV